MRPPAEGHWFSVPNAVVDAYGLAVGPTAVLAYLILRRHANEDGVAYPSLSRIAQLLGRDRSYTIRVIRRLEDAGLVGVTRDGTRHNRYEFPPLVAPAPLALVAPAPPEVCAGGANDTRLVAPAPLALVAPAPPEEDQAKRPKEEDLSSRREGEPSPADFLAAWNAVQGVRPAQKMTAARTRALRTRIADPWWRANWTAALERVARSAFCTGRNGRGWRADVDWFLRPDSATRILEGRYDSNFSAANRNGGTDGRDRQLHHRAGTVFEADQGSPAPY